jgi:esterase
LENLLLKNIKRSGEHFEWKSNPQIIHDNMPNIYAALHSEKEYNGETMVIGGELSDYIRKEDVEIMRKHFPQMKFVQLKNAGHWLHVDQQSNFMQILETILPDLSAFFKF